MAGAPAFICPGCLPQDRARKSLVPVFRPALKLRAATELVCPPQDMELAQWALLGQEPLPRTLMDAPVAPLNSDIGLTPEHHIAQSKDSSSFCHLAGKHLSRPDTWAMSCCQKAPHCPVGGLDSVQPARQGAPWPAQVRSAGPTGALQSPEDTDPSLRDALSLSGLCPSSEHPRPNTVHFWSFQRLHQKTGPRGCWSLWGSAALCWTLKSLLCTSNTQPGPHKRPRLQFHLLFHRWNLGCPWLQAHHPGFL